jgi:intracellular septation protein A
MMKSVADVELGSPAPHSIFVPAFPQGLLRNVAIDMAMPWIAIQLLTRTLGISSPMAVALAALFPAASMLVNWWRRHRVDFIGLVVLVMLIGSGALVLITQDIRFVLLKPVAGAAVFGVACLATLGRQAPLMFFLARQVTAGDDPEKLAAWTARLSDAGFRRAMQVLTLVWGLAFIAKAALWTLAVLLLPPNAALLAAPVFGISIFTALMAWTIAFARRGAARLAAAQS